MVFSRYQRIIIVYDGDREIKKWEECVGNIPSELEGRMDVNGEVEEIDAFCTGSGSSFNAVITVAQRKLGNKAGTGLEQTVPHSQQAGRHCLSPCMFPWPYLPFVGNGRNQKINCNG